MESTDARLARLRAEITDGTYAPPPDAVAESLVAWIARPEQFERGAARADDHADRAVRDRRDKEGRR
jgi:hypothetical protein